MKAVFLSIFCALCLTGLAAPPENEFNVVWDSPSADHHGSMPLGNGDIALNAWMTAEGDLHFYISKTDAWDDNARLVKVGKVRVHFEPNPLRLNEAFRQELRLEEGIIEIRCAPDASKLAEQPAATIRLWVDANHPVIHVTAKSSQPLTATTRFELWRTNQHELAELQTSDVMVNRKLPNGKQAPTIIEPDKVLQNQPGRIGWFHHNIKSVGPQILAEIQGLSGFPQTDPLLARTFGAVVKANQGQRIDDFQLRSGESTEHRFSVFVLTQHPASPDQWLAAMDRTIQHVESIPFLRRNAAHAEWWRNFWDRSWIRASTRTGETDFTTSIVPPNNYPFRIGTDQSGGNKYRGELGRVSVIGKALTDKEVTGVASLHFQENLPDAFGPILFTAHNLKPQILTNALLAASLPSLTLEAWLKPEKLGESGARVLDKITPGQRDGFLFDTYPGNSLRFICGEIELLAKDATPAGQWTHVAAVADSEAGGCRMYVNGKLVADNSGPAVRDEAAYVSQMYQLQRFITACAGRGAHPIKFNGSLFTVPPGPTETDPDYRRWGPGYWWQNTRLPYISLCTSGDFDLQHPLFRMYAKELLPLCRYRTQLYLRHDGVFYPECIMFWGPVFSETYGWTPFEERQDKLQESGWHKWEWVSGLELCWMMLDYWDHTRDGAFLDHTLLPMASEVLTFFDQHYPTNTAGKLVMHPSQALETWWHCTNAIPELAGCKAVAERLLLVQKELGASWPDAELWTRLLAKLPPIPLREINGKKALAPAEFFADKRNIENPELYPVFPFRLFAFNRPNPELALAALEHRWDRGHSGWRQDDIFMAYLGLVDSARKALVSRAKSHDRNERFPAFWGPNFDWTPDQDHGGILMKTFQSMLLQTDGKQMFLLPAWPKHWDVEFKLHAPHRTVIEGAYRAGQISELKVTPVARWADLVLPKQN